MQTSSRAEALKENGLVRRHSAASPSLPGRSPAPTDPAAGTVAPCPRRRRRDAGTAHAMASIPSAANTCCKGLLPQFPDIQLLKSDLHCFEVTGSPVSQRTFVLMAEQTEKNTLTIFRRRHFAAQNEPLYPFASAFTSVTGPKTSALLHWERGCWAASGTHGASVSLPAA